MMPTWMRPGTITFCPGPWAWTSAEGLSTRKYSAGRLNFLPSSNSISSRFSARIRRSWTGQGALSGIAARLGRLFLVVAEAARLVDQHDRDAVADRVGEAGLVADQLLGRAVVAQRRLGQRAGPGLQELGVDVE